MEKKILVAVDGSYCSLNEINYLSRVFREGGDVTLHMLCIVSASLSSSTQWLDDGDRMNMLSDDAKRRFRLAEKHIREEVNFLTRHGFKEKMITSEVRLSRAGVANDLAAEMQKGSYDALLMGRRGLGRLQGLVMGSVTKEILEKCFHLPIWIVDGEVTSRNFLVPVDGSRRSLRALDHLAFVLEGLNDVEITLFHSAAWLKEKKKEEVEKLHEIWGKEWCDEHLSRSDAIFHGPEQILRESGFDMENVSRADVSRGVEPALDIMLQLRNEKYGTIVMGRRGPDDPKGFFGGVSSRVLWTVNDLAVWLVN
ncbi:MAG: universal stress protein [Pseudomonadota bacterium]